MTRSEVQRVTRWADGGDRRARKRFAIRAPILFWNTSNEQSTVFGGFTKNVSESGLYVLCEAADRPKAGKQLKIEVLLPSPNSDSAPNVRLKSTGRVLRVSSIGQPSGFAVLARFGWNDV